MNLKNRAFLPVATARLVVLAMLSAPIPAGLGVAQAAAPPMRAAGEVAIDYQPDAGLIGLRAQSATLEDVLTEIENTTGVEVVRHRQLPQFVDVDLAPMPLKPFFEALLDGYNVSIMGGEGAQQVTKVWVMSASRRPPSPARVAGEVAGSLESPRGSGQAAAEHSAGPARGEDTSEVSASAHIQSDQMATYEAWLQRGELPGAELELDDYNEMMEMLEALNTKLGDLSNDPLNAPALDVPWQSLRQQQQGRPSDGSNAPRTFP